MHEGEWLRTFQEALLNAFPTQDGLRQMVRYGLDQNLEEFAPVTNLRSTVFEVLRWAESNGKLDAVLASALKANPENPRLLAFAREPRPPTVPHGAPAPPFCVPFRQNTEFIGRDEDLVHVH